MTEAKGDVPAEPQGDTRPETPAGPTTVPSTPISAVPPVPAPPPPALAPAALALPPPPPGWDPSQSAALPPPPPPPGSQAFATVGAQGRAIISRLDPTGIRPTVYVGAVLLVLVFGSVLLNGILPARASPGGPGPGGPGPQVPAGTPIEFAGGVRIYPLAGWVADPPTADHLRLQRGGVVLDAFVFATAPADAAAVVGAYVNGTLQPSAPQLATSDPQVVPLGGSTGVRISYTGNFTGVQQPLEGQVTGVIINGRAIVFDGWAAQGQLSTGLADVERMVATTEVR